MTPCTARLILRRIIMRIRQQPLALFLALAVVPTLWNVPADLAYDQVIPDESRTSGTAPPLLDAVMLSAVIVWSCMLYGGQLLIAIDAVRRERVSWRRFRDGLPQTARLAVTSLPFFLPWAVLMHFPEGPWLDVLALPLIAVTIVIVVILVARTIIWAPLLVDSTLSVSQALAASWAATRGLVWAIVRLGVLLCALVIPVGVAESAVHDEFDLTFGVLGALYILAVAELYAHTLPRPPTPSNVATEEVSEAPLDLPNTGSGWSRPYD